ncbi:MAG: hypothetical protein Q7R72_02000 [bacterium]|nr:hypothetical protein [bacterium]
MSFLAFLQGLVDTIVVSLRGVGQGITNFLPELLGAVVIVIVGWIVGALVGRLVAHIIKVIKLDSLLENAGFGNVVKRAGFNLNSGRFVGGLVEWFIIVAFLVAAFDVLGLTQVNVFLQSVVLLYLPQVIVAVLILLVSVVIADALSKVVVGSARAAGVHSANFLGTVTRWSIWIFALLAALVQLGIAVGFIQTLFTGVIVALSLAFGLSFGLGGQEAAARYVERIRGEIASHHHNG